MWTTPNWQLHWIENLAHMRRKNRSNYGDPEDYTPLENPEQLIASRNLRERQFNDSLPIGLELPAYRLENPLPMYRYINSPDRQRLEGPLSIVQLDIPSLKPLRYLLLLALPPPCLHWLLLVPIQHFNNRILGLFCLQMLCSIYAIKLWQV